MNTHMLRIHKLRLGSEACYKIRCSDLDENNGIALRCGVCCKAVSLRRDEMRFSQRRDDEQYMWVIILVI
jgi:hypothetical protein